ncbi:MAG TPA: hypothetical protein VK387_06025 [Thermoleophilaceae bacterium]|nr:hypothetical protein [Thermoleophilaceae bacterium]
MGSSFGLLASGVFFVAVGVAAIIVEQRWPGGILAVLVAAPLVVIGIRGLLSDEPDEGP